MGDNDRLNNKRLAFSIELCARIHQSACDVMDVAPRLHVSTHLHNVTCRGRMQGVAGRRGLRIISRTVADAYNIAQLRTRHNYTVGGGGVCRGRGVSNFRHFLYWTSVPLPQSLTLATRLGFSEGICYTLSGKGNLLEGRLLCKSLAAAGEKISSSNHERSGSVCGDQFSRQ